jgi:23S rRNA pseudouridine1911/1915/1917 synthase
MRKQITVMGQFAGERADKYLAAHVKDVSRSRVQDAFAHNQVLLGGQPIPKSHRVARGDVLTIELVALPTPEVNAVEGSLTVLFEDEDVLVLNKTSGLIMHPGSGTGEDTLVHFALHHTGGKLSHLGGPHRPGIVHRLDKDTSGAVVLAKSDRAYLELIKYFSEREVAKEYLAIVQGVPKLRSGSQRESIGRNPVVRVKMAVVRPGKGKDAHTDWSVVEAFGHRAALVRCWLHTGRTHQIRVHMAHLGHILLGDQTYGWKPRTGDTARPRRVMLHAEVLAFTHPATGEPLEFRAPLPTDFVALTTQLREEAARDAIPKVMKRVKNVAGSRPIEED